MSGEAGFMNLDSRKPLRRVGCAPSAAILTRFKETWSIAIRPGNHPTPAELRFHNLTGARLSLGATSAQLDGAEIRHAGPRRAGPRCGHEIRHQAAAADHGV